MTDYEALKAFGHSPAKAAEIKLDAMRRDRHALAWIKAARAAQPAPVLNRIPGWPNLPNS